MPLASSMSETEKSDDEIRRTRVRSEETSRLSTYIGVVVAVILIAVALYLVMFGFSKTKEVTGFDPNRPVPSDAVLKARLNPLQYHVAREKGTETAFQNEFWNNERKGIYVDVITGEPLFTSLDKFDGATGRPTFTKPISKDSIAETLDTSHDMQRTEVSARRSGAHLGHIFPDPKSPTGQRYAVNSAAFHFIAFEAMESSGYKDFLPLFQQTSPAPAGAK
jgi:peptide-methionine (R)-S-oxide reductase